MFALILFTSALVQAQSATLGPYPAFGVTTIGNPAWDALFLTGQPIPTIPLKNINAGSDLTTDVNNCGTNTKNWALAFDDGPGPFSDSHRVYLKANKLPATFFMIGRQIPAMAAYVKLVADDPTFEVCMHTWSHRYLFSLTNTEIVGEVVWAAKAIYDATGKVPRYLRPPYGSIDERVRAILKAMDVVPITWDVDSNDWQLDGVPATMTPAQVINGWTTSIATSHPNGVISLQHDITQVTIAIGETTLLPAFKATSYKPVLMSTCNVGLPYATSGKLFQLLAGNATIPPVIVPVIVPTTTANVVPATQTLAPAVNGNGQAAVNDADVLRIGVRGLVIALLAMLAC